MAFLSPTLRHRYFTAAGLPLAGGKIWSYAAGTTTPLPTFTDRSETTQNANPLILDANGEGQMWLSSSAYKFVLMDSSDVVQWTVDSVRSAQNATFEAIQPLTTKGDLLGHSGAQAQRFPVGTDGHVLTADSPSTNGVKWALPHPLTTKGDLFTFGAAIAARLPVGTDGQVLIADSAEATGLKWGAATGGGGAENYISNSNAEVNTAGWLVDSVSAAARPSGALTGTSTGLTFTRTTTNPLNGIASFLISKDAVNRQGRLAYYNLTLPAKSKAKVMSIRFPYRVVSGTFVVGSTSVDSDCIVYVRQYNGSTYTWSEPSSFKFLSNSTTLADEFRAEFQTLSDTISADLVFYVATTSASAWVLAIDDVNLGPSNYVYGTPITDFNTQRAFTSNITTNTTFTASSAKNGDRLVVMAQWTFSGVNTQAGPGSVVLAGLTIDSTKLPSSNRTAVGQWYARNAGSGASSSGAVISAISSGGATLVFLEGFSPSANLPYTIASGHEVSAEFAVPIAGWSSSVQMSDQTDTRIVAASAARATSGFAVGTGATKVQWNSTLSDTHGALDTTTNYRYTVPVAGKYQFSGAISFAATASFTGYSIILYKNGAGLKTQTGIGSASTSAGGAFNFDDVAVVGDYYEVYVTTTGAASTILSGASINGGSTWDIKRISGPSAIAASETVAVKYTTSTARTINNTTPTIIYENKVLDTHAAYNTSTGVFTVPVGGTYIFLGGFGLTGVATTVGHNNILRVFVDGALATDLAAAIATTTSSVTWRSYGSTSLPLLAGQLVTFRFYADTTNTLLASQPESNHISIARIGL